MIKTQIAFKTHSYAYLIAVFLLCSPLQIFAFSSKLKYQSQSLLLRSGYSNRKSFNLYDYPKKSPFVDLSNDIITDELTSNDVSYVSIQPSNYTARKRDGIVEETSDDVPSSADELNMVEFGSIFRQCAPYIAMHRGSTMVIHLGGQALNEREDFDAIIDDISILHLLGVQLVLVAGVRKQLDEKMMTAGRKPQYHDGMRISDEETMKFLKETSGSARFEIESSLARGFRGRPGQSGISVVSGNFFYSAKPLGVRDGVDFKLTGEVRRIEVENLKKRLEAGDVVMLTSVGYSPSGEVFNVPSESLAAARLKAAKIIYLTDGEAMVDTRSGKFVQSLRLAQAVSLLDACGIKTKMYNQVEADQDNGRSAEEDVKKEKDESVDTFGNLVHADVESLPLALNLEVWHEQYGRGIRTSSGKVKGTTLCQLDILH
jgi:acetylglutamate kinase